MKLLSITKGCVKFGSRTRGYATFHSKFKNHIKFDSRTKGYVEFHLEACTRSKLSGHQTQNFMLICNYYGTTSRVYAPGRLILQTWKYSRTVSTR
jgi:hypothetical protein